MTNTAIYLRISQDQTGEGLALDRQEDECRKFADERGWTVTQVYKDDSISATSGAHRPAFDALLEDKPSLVVVWHLDRLVRVTKDLERVIDAGLSVHAVKAGMLDLSTPAGRAVARTVTAWSTYEGEQKSARQMSRNQQDRAAGRPYWRRPPFGFTTAAEHQPEEAEAVRWAYQALLDGVSLGAIARNWTERGLKPHQKGKEFGSVTVRGVLLSPRNAGILTYQGKELGPGSWDAIVPEETFRAAVAILTQAGRYQGGGGRLANLLTGIAECGVCGETMVKGTLQSNRGPAYVCKHKRHNRHPLQETEGVVIGATLAALTDGKGEALLTDQDRDLEALRARATALRTSLKEWEAAAADLGPAEYLRITRKIREELAEVLEEMSRKDAGSLLVTPDGQDWTSEDVINRAYEVWESLPLAKRQAILRLLWKRIVLRPRSEPKNSVMGWVKLEYA